MGFQDIIRIFMPKEDHFYDYLERQAKAAQDGAKALSKFSNGTSAEDARDAVQKIEQRHRAPPIAARTPTSATAVSVSSP